MSKPSGIHVVIPSGADRWEEILGRAVAPLAGELRHQHGLRAFHFARFNKPSFHLGVGILGDEPWLSSCARPLVDRFCDPLAARGAAHEYTIGPYSPDASEYGGEEAMRLTERLFHHDSLACLDLMQAEADGRLRRTRREYTLLMVEKMLDLMRFDRERKMAFYRRGYEWALGIGSLNETEMAALEKRFGELRAGLTELVSPDERASAEWSWGGPEAARIAGEFLEAAAPILAEALEAHADGRISKDLGELAWSWARVHSNRLGVLNVAEASLRFFMHRLHAEGESGAA